MMDLKKLQHYLVIQVFFKGGSIGWIASKSISSIYLSEINKLKNNQISKPIKTNKNIAIIKLNNKRIINRENINLAIN